jgi:RimJ/RimL family protein N-acetyltransferase
MSRRSQKLLEMGSRYGWRAAARVCRYWVLLKLVNYREATLYCLDLEDAMLPERCGQVEWSYLSPDEVDLATRNAFALPQSALTRLSDKRDRIFIGTASGAPCYFSTVSKGGFIMFGRIHISFSGNSDAYVGDCSTLPEFRGRGVYPCALATLALTLRSDGCRRLYLYIEAENLASQRAVAKAGFRPLGAFSMRRGVSGLKTCWHLVDHKAADYTSTWTVRVSEYRVGESIAYSAKLEQK